MMQNTQAFEVFYDGQCPLCLREINFLKRRDQRGRLKFTDISVPDFDASLYGMSMHDFMAQIRGRLPDGTFISGVEVFRQLYSAVGLGWAVKASRLPGLSKVLESGYQYFAKNRLRFTGRCEDDACTVPSAKSQPSTKSQMS